MVNMYTEADLERELECRYQEWGELGLWAKRFHQRFSPGRKRYEGGVAAVQRMLMKDPSRGFVYLRDRNRLDLTVEQLVLQPECGRLFTEAERSLARGRLGCP